MMAFDITKGNNVENELERTKHQSLRNTLGQKSSGGDAVVNFE